jgi:hypothetical protein
MLVLAALSLPAPAAQAATTRISIDPNATVHNIGQQVEVMVRYTCDAAFGTVMVQLNQEPPETFAPTSGSGIFPAVCNGKQQESIVTVHSGCCGLFDAGRALARAQLLAPTLVDTDEKEITLTNN